MRQTGKKLFGKPPADSAGGTRECRFKVTRGRLDGGGHRGGRDYRRGTCRGDSLRVHGHRGAGATWRPCRRFTARQEGRGRPGSRLASSPTHVSGPTSGQLIRRSTGSSSERRLARQGHTHGARSCRIRRAALRMSVRSPDRSAHRTRCPEASPARLDEGLQLDQATSNAATITPPSLE